MLVRSEVGVNPSKNNRFVRFQKFLSNVDILDKCQNQVRRYELSVLQNFFFLLVVSIPANGVWAFLRLVCHLRVFLVVISHRKSPDNAPVLGRLRWQGHLADWKWRRVKKNIASTRGVLKVNFGQIEIEEFKVSNYGTFTIKLFTMVIITLPL